MGPFLPRPFVVVEENVLLSCTYGMGVNMYVYICIYKNPEKRILLRCYKVQRMVGFYALSIAKVSKFIVTPVG